MDQSRVGACAFLGLGLLIGYAVRPPCWWALSEMSEA